MHCGSWLGHPTLPAATWSNLHVLHAAAFRYVEERRGVFPASLQELYDEGYVRQLSIFVRPSSRSEAGSDEDIDGWAGYVYRHPGIALTNGLDAKAPMMWLVREKEWNVRDGTAGAYVVRVDGILTWLPCGSL